MDQVQLRAKARIIVEEGAFARGDVFWTNEKRARMYIAQDVAEPIGVGLPGPEKDPAEKKPSSAAPDGPSIASAKSSVPGTAPTLFPSPADRVSPAPKSRGSRRGARAPKGGAGAA